MGTEGVQDCASLCCLVIEGLGMFGNHKRLLFNIDDPKRFVKEEANIFRQHSRSHVDNDFGKHIYMFTVS